MDKSRRRASAVELTAEYLRSILNYDPATGLFHWKMRIDIEDARIRRTWNTRFAGKVAGTVKKSDNSDSLFYLQICINGKVYKAHRLAWLYVKGEWPEGSLDHRDGDGLNNRFKNIRPATASQNSANSAPTRGRTLPKGVHRKRGRYFAIIGHNRKQRHLGTFDTPEEASAAYQVAARECFGDYARSV